MMTDRKKNYLTRRAISIICWLTIIVADISVFVILGLLLMGYDDFYDSSKGEYWTLASMNTTEKTVYICYNIWMVINIVGLVCAFIYAGMKIYKRVRY